MKQNLLYSMKFCFVQILLRLKTLVKNGGSLQNKKCLYLNNLYFASYRFLKKNPQFWVVFEFYFFKITFKVNLQIH